MLLTNRTEMNDLPTLRIVNVLFRMAYRDVVTSLEKNLSITNQSFISRRYDVNHKGLDYLMV